MGRERRQGGVPTDVTVTTGDRKVNSMGV